MKYSDMESVIKHQPRKLGLRGDAYLYFEMEAYFTGVIIPDKSDFERIMITAFEEITGSSIDSVESIYVEKLAHGGMSSGMIGASFWKEEIIPYLSECAYKGT